MEARSSDLVWKSGSIPISQSIARAHYTSQTIRLTLLCFATQRVALSFCGYGDLSNWTRAQKLITSTPDRGRKWLQGGYKDEPTPVGAEWDEDELFARGKDEGAKLKSALEGMRKVVASVDKI